MNQVLIINGHPDSESFCHALHESYKKGAIAEGKKVEEIILSAMSFDPNLKHGYRKRTELEPNLVEAQAKIKRADHIVWIYPIWWGTPPALMKGFIDRVFLPGFAFEYQEKSPFPKKLLNGKTCEIIVTMDTPVIYYKLFFKSVGVRMIRSNVSAFCGIKNKRTTHCTPISSSTTEQRSQWLEKVEKLPSRL